MGTGNDLLYTGREYDQETNLYYYRARYYDAEIGRFISEDPLGFQAGINFYAYVNNNPVNFNDPFGREGYPACVGCIFPIELLTNPFTLFMGVSGNVPLTGVGVSPGIAMSTDGQVGGFFEMAPTPNAFVRDALGTFDSDVSSNLNGLDSGLDLTRMSLDIGFQTGSVEQMAGVNYNGFAGALGVGVTVLGNDQGVNGAALNIGPQARVGTEVTLTAVAGFDFSAFDFFSAGFNASSTPAAGGFVLYPSKINDNLTQRVYSK